MKNFSRNFLAIVNVHFRFAENASDIGLRADADYQIYNIKTKEEKKKGKKR